MSDESPYAGKSIEEIVHDYAVVRGDLVEQYARDQMVNIVERRIAQARREGAAEAWNAGWDAGQRGVSLLANPYRAAALRGDA